MNLDKTKLYAYFHELGLTNEIADIYFTLVLRGEQTISDLARNSEVERTRVYRLLNELQANNLIEVEVRYKRQILRAAPIDNLQLLIQRKEENLQTLQGDFAKIQELLEITKSMASPTTKVQFYQGAEGLKQMLWNQTRVKTEIISILYENMQIHTNTLFFERWAHRINEKDIATRGVVGDHFVESQRQWYATHTNERLGQWEQRYVSTDTYPITHSTICYDDVVGYFNWKDNEIFGIETHNPEIAQSTRQLFNLLWDKATPLEDTFSDISSKD